MMTVLISLWVSHEAISRFFEKGLSIPEVALISGHRIEEVMKYFFIFISLIFTFNVFFIYDLNTNMVFSKKINLIFM